jgi:hypothetical protein
MEKKVLLLIPIVWMCVQCQPQNSSVTTTGAPSPAPAHTAAAMSSDTLEPEYDRHLRRLKKTAEIQAALDRLDIFTTDFHFDVTDSAVHVYGRAFTQEDRDSILTAIQQAGGPYSVEDHMAVGQLEERPGAGREEDSFLKRVAGFFALLFSEKRRP